MTSCLSRLPLACPSSAGQTPRVLTNTSIHKGQPKFYYDLRLLYKVPDQVSEWQLEYTLCSLRQYLESQALSCLLAVIERPVPSGIQTEFWITSNGWRWTAANDDEVLDILAMFMCASRSDIVLVSWQITDTPLAPKSPPIPLLPPHYTSQASPAPVQPNPPTDTWRIDALVASWSEIPSPTTRAFTPLSDIEEDEDDYDEGTDTSEPSEVSKSESSESSSSRPPDSSPTAAPTPRSDHTISPLSSPSPTPSSTLSVTNLASLPAHSITDDWLGSLLDPWPEDWAGLGLVYSSSPSPSSGQSSPFVPGAMFLSSTPDALGF